MRTDYFDGLLYPTYPTSKNTSGAAANAAVARVTPLTPLTPQKNGEARKLGCDTQAEKNGQAFTNFGRGYQHPDGRIETGKPEPAPPASVAWPTNLDGMLRRVACAFEWSRADVADFRQWARRSPEGLAEARQFLEDEAAKLPVAGLSERRRVVLDMLKADQAITYAWTCADDGADPVTLTLAIRDKGACELAIPRSKLDTLGLPQLIERLSTTQEDAA